MNDYKYEVAISCLKEDASLAQQLYDFLQPRVRSIFFYPHNQADLVARDGLEAFQGVFRRESRVVVVIYREGWGQTRWTAIEEIAIKEMCFDAGWSRIVLYSEDEKIPKWLPQSYIWAGKRYGLSALASVIEQKVQEAGGTVGEEDVVAKAQRIQRSLAAAKAREDRRFSEEAVQVAYRERKAVDARLAEVVTNLATPDPSGLLHGEKISGMYTVQTSDVAVAFYWNGNTVNSIQGDTLTLLMSTGPLRYGWREDAKREVAKYELELAEEEATWRWVEIERDLHYTSVELADEAVRRLMDEHERRRKAALQRQRRGPVEDDRD